MELSGGHAMINLSLFLVKDEKRWNAVSGIEAKVGSGIVCSGNREKEPCAKRLFIDNDTCREAQ